MAKKKPEFTNPPKEKAFLVGVEFFQQKSDYNLGDSLQELAMLADTAGLEVVGSTTQKLDHPNPHTFIGKGKVDEVKALADELTADLVLFDDELSPRHLRELEEQLGAQMRILDRTALILDIFAQHAVSREGSLQVELAQYEYRLPRLTRAWTHLARQAGGGGGRAGSVGGVGLRGPGETQLEVDRRDIRRRISHLKEELEKVRIHRRQYRSRRQKSNIPVVALVGYTNAGKSTLLNTLSGAGVLVANQLFATLDPTTRRLELPGGYPVLLTDTVGFIQKLPTTLVAAFRATLEEISEADLLLHVVDITHVNARQQALAVHHTLDEISASHIPLITVLNKSDLLSDPERANEVLEAYPNAVAVSALKGYGIESLKSSLRKQLYESSVPISVKIPNSEAGLIQTFINQGQVERLENLDKFTTIAGTLPGRYLARYADYEWVVSENLPE